ncbi:hypothetical protein CAJAP_03929 [Camponotus japonicus]
MILTYQKLSCCKISLEY